MDSYIVLISKFGCADDGKAASEDEGGERSPSPSAGARLNHPKGARSVARKRPSSAGTTSNR